MGLIDWDIYNGGFDGVSLRYFVLPTSPFTQYFWGYPAAGIGQYPAAFNLPRMPDDLEPLAQPCLSFGFSRTSVNNAYSINAVAKPSIRPGVDGYNIGILQTEMQIYAGWTPGGVTAIFQGTMNAGICCMQSSRDMNRNGGGTGYALGFNNAGYQNVVRLYGCTNGLSTDPTSIVPSTYRLLGTSAQYIWEFNAWYTLTLFWFSDPYFLHGTWLRAWLTRRSVVTELFNIVDVGRGAVANVLSAGEGPYAVGQANEYTAMFRNMKLFWYPATTVNGAAYPPP